MILRVQVLILHPKKNHILKFLAVVKYSQFLFG